MTTPAVTTCTRSWAGTIPGRASHWDQLSSLPISGCATSRAICLRAKHEVGMKPAAFDYYAPTTIDDVMMLLRRHGSDARLLAGGQTLLPMMNFRLAAPEVIIDLNRIPELAFIKVVEGRVHIGAMTRQRAVEFSPIVARDLPLLHEAHGRSGGEVR
jgi:xanthine dehydrogenase iron-sulfur cluster and FAD-binding subunit A